MARRPPNQDTSYHELLDALGELGCAVCRRAEESVEATIAAILHEQVTDPGFREDLLRSGGFCHEHAWRVVEHHDILGTAILHRALLIYLTERGDRRGAALCALCRSRETAVEITIGTLVNHLEDGALRKRLAQSDGLCEQHFERAMAASGRAARLAEAQDASRARLLRDLDELIRKQDYRFMHEPDEGEGNAWLRAVAAASGLDLNALPRRRSSKLPPARDQPP